MLTKLLEYMGDDLPFFAGYGMACGTVGWVVIELLRWAALHLSLGWQ